MPEIQSVITLSISHIKEETAQLLQNAHEESILIENVVVFEKKDYGYFVYFNASTIPDSIPDDFKQVLEYAKHHHSELIVLDRDGPCEEELEQFDW